MPISSLPARCCVQAKNIHLFMSLGYKAETILPDHYDHLDLICFAKYR